MEEVVHEMGELTTVGPVIYNVLETEWRTQLGDPVEPMIPERRFLIVRLTVNNSGNQQAAIPLLNVVDSEGDSHLEVSEVKGVRNWLGLLRILEPAAAVQGRIVFDVEPSDYMLRVTDGGNLEDERTALVSLPLSLDTPGVEVAIPGSTPEL